MSAIAKEAADAIVTIIQALSLSGMTSSNIVARKIPTSRNLTDPHITVSPATESEEDGTTGADDWIFPFTVAICKATNQALELDDTFMQWRETIRHAFHNKKPATLVSALTPPLKTVRVENGPILDMQNFQANQDVSTLTINVIVRRVR